jgi:hypothetical protein
MVVMTLFFVAVVAAGSLAYRLSRGPLEIPWAATKLANIASGQDVEIHIGRAELAWQGYKAGSRAPLFLELEDVSVRDTSGALLATIPEAQLAFSLGALFAARAPIYVSSRNAHVMGADAPVSLLAGIRLGAAFTLASADLWVTLGAGQLGPPGLGEAVTSGKFLLRLTPGDARLDHGVLKLQPFGQSAPVLRIAATAHKDGDWHGTVTLSADAVQAADLSHYWPTQLAALTRDWVTRNIVAGSARNARFTLNLSAPLRLATLQLDEAAGSFEADDLTLIWLPHVRPFTALDGIFTLTDADNIDIAANTGRLGGITLTGAHMHIAGVSHPDQIASLQVPVSGSLQDVFSLLNGPGLELLKTVPPPVHSATGEITGTVNVTLPLQKRIEIADVRMNVATVLTDVTLPSPVQGLTLTQGRLTVDATLRSLRVAGGGTLAGEPASLTSTADFRATGAAAQVDLRTIATAAMLRDVGIEPGHCIEGNVPADVHVATTANGGRLNVNADLTPAALALPVFGWRKPAGQPGRFSFAASINGDRFSGIDRIERIAAKAPGLDVETIGAGNGIDLTHVQIGDTEGSGRIVPPAGAHLPWQIRLTGNALDLSAEVNPPHPAAKPAKAKTAQPSAAPPPAGILWDATAHFDRLVLARSPEPALMDFNFAGHGRGDFVYQAVAAAQLDAGKAMSLTITPAPGTGPGESESLQLETEDAGRLLRAIGAFDDLSGGKLELTASYGGTVPTHGVTRMTDFRLLNAPAIGKFLQAITVLGIPEAASGPGLLFNRLVMPFSIDDQVMTLEEARAYSESLGVTAAGTIDLDASLYDIHGTVVPAYALNALPGKIPLIGRLFSPEKGGGLFAMRYSMTGPIADPEVKVNPFSALTPGFLRGIFGIGTTPEAK